MAQQGLIIPTAATPSFPGCALSCQLLWQAQSICMPPTVQQSSQSVYNQCFCNSPYLTPFASTTDGVCVADCTILTDRQLLQAWFNNFCAQVRQGIDPTTATSTVAPTDATATGVTTSTSTSQAGSSARAHRESWIEGHWKWVLMLGILVIGLGLIAWLVIWLKRRHRRKVDKRRARASGLNYDPEKRPANDPTRSATPDLWGPHQMMHATQGFGYVTPMIEETANKKRKRIYRGAESSRKPENDIIGIADIDKGSANLRPSTQRVRPSDLELNARMIGAADRRSKSRGKSRADESNVNPKEVAVGANEHQRGNVKSSSNESEVEKT